MQLPAGGKAAAPGRAAEAPGEEKKEEKAVRIPEKPRPMKQKEPEKKPEKKTEKKPEEEEKPKSGSGDRGEARPSGREGGGSVAGTGVGVGAGTGSGIVSLDGVDFPFLYYLALIEARIGDRWVPPEGLASGGTPPSATIRFDILRGGEVHNPQVALSSGISYFDLSAIRAVLDSGPFPPLPDGFSGDRLGVNFVFRFER